MSTSDLKKEYERLTKSKVFNKKGFLCSIFAMCDDKQDSPEWQIDFYSKKEDAITSYLMKQDIKIIENSEIFKKENVKIKKLNLEDVKISYEEIPKLTKKFLDKEKLVKAIIILQQNTAPLWNLSYITDSFNLINIKINAENGKILEQTKSSLLSFKN